MNQQYRIDDNAKAIMILKNKGVTHIQAQYSGGGDEGYIDHLHFLGPNNNEIKLDDRIHAEDYDYIENWMCNIIVKTSWQKGADVINNDGGYAKLEINLLDMDYTVDIDEYVTETIQHHDSGDVQDLIDDY